MNNIITACGSRFGHTLTRRYSKGRGNVPKIIQNKFHISKILSSTKLLWYIIERHNTRKWVSYGWTVFMAKLRRHRAKTTAYLVHWSPIHANLTPGLSHCWAKRSNYQRYSKVGILSLHKGRIFTWLCNTPSCVQSSVLRTTPNGQACRVTVNKSAEDAIDTRIIPVPDHYAYHTLGASNKSRSRLPISWRTASRKVERRDEWLVAKGQGTHFERNYWKNLISYYKILWYTRVL